METLKRRFCRYESAEEPSDQSAADAPHKALASALDRYGIPYELVVNRLDRKDLPADPDSCDQYPNGIAPLSVFVYEFLTTDRYYHRACSVAAQIHPNPDSDPEH